MMKLSNILEDLPNGFEKYSGDCEKHGQFNSLRRINSEYSECPQCAQAQTLEKSMEEIRAEKIKHLVKNANLPLKFVNAGLRNFNVLSEAHNKARQTIANYLGTVKPSKSTWAPLIIVGSVGSGKTHLSCALANNLIDKGVSVRYTTVALMLADIRSAYGKIEGITEIGQISRYINDFDLLILDEADIMIRSDNDVSLLFSVINGRYNAMKSIVVVSNKSTKDLDKFIGERSLDRILENSTLVVCDWKSHRRAE